MGRLHATSDLVVTKHSRVKLGYFDRRFVATAFRTRANELLLRVIAVDIELKSNN